MKTRTRSLFRALEDMAAALADFDHVVVARFTRLRQAQMLGAGFRINLAGSTPPIARIEANRRARRGRETSGEEARLAGECAALRRAVAAALRGATEALLVAARRVSRPSGPSSSASLAWASPPRSGHDAAPLLRTLSADLERMRTAGSFVFASVHIALCDHANAALPSPPSGRLRREGDGGDGGCVRLLEDVGCCLQELCHALRSFGKALCHGGGGMKTGENSGIGSDSSGGVRLKDQLLGDLLSLRSHYETLAAQLLVCQEGCAKALDARATNGGDATADILAARDILEKSLQMASPDGPASAPAALAHPVELWRAALRSMRQAAACLSSGDFSEVGEPGEPGEENVAASDNASAESVLTAGHGPSSATALQHADAAERTVNGTFEQQGGGVDGGWEPENDDEDAAGEQRPLASYTPVYTGVSEPARVDDPDGAAAWGIDPAAPDPRAASLLQGELQDVLAAREGALPPEVEVGDSRSGCRPMKAVGKADDHSANRPGGAVEVEGRPCPPLPLPLPLPLPPASPLMSELASFMSRALPSKDEDLFEG